MIALSAVGVTRKFGGIVALDGISFEAHDNEVLGVVGPNGAGKTTLFNALSGLVKPDSGEIVLRGRQTTGMSPHRLASAGMQRTFQHIRLFDGLDVADNVAVGGFAGRRRSRRSVRASAEALLTRVGCPGIAEAFPSELPYATQRRVEIARALAARPTVLLLDEPAAGMHHEDKDSLSHLIRQLSIEGMCILLIEHDMALVSATCDRIIVMDFGKEIAQGTPAEIKTNPVVLRAYLGDAS